MNHIVVEGKSTLWGRLPHVSESLSLSLSRINLYASILKFAGIRPLKTVQKWPNQKHASFKLNHRHCT